MVFSEPKHRNGLPQAQCHAFANGSTAPSKGLGFPERHFHLVKNRFLFFPCWFSRESISLLEIFFAFLSPGDLSKWRGSTYAHSKHVAHAGWRHAGEGCRMKRTSPGIDDMRPARWPICGRRGPTQARLIRRSRVWTKLCYFGSDMGIALQLNYVLYPPTRPGGPLKG